MKYIPIFNKLKKYLFITDIIKLLGSFYFSEEKGL